MERTTGLINLHNTNATINIKTNKNKEDAKLFLFKIHKKDKKTTLKAVRIITEKNSHRIEAENIECSQESNNDMIRALGFILLSGEEFKLKTKIDDINFIEFIELSFCSPSISPALLLFLNK